MMKKIIDIQNVKVLWSLVVPFAAMVMAKLTPEVLQPASRRVKNDEDLLMPTAPQSTGYFVSHNPFTRR